MAIAKQCDRCHKLYLPYHANVMKQKVNGLNIVDRNDDNSNYSIRQYIDLCPDCMGVFTIWLNGFAEEKDGASSQM